MKGKVALVAAIGTVALASMAGSSLGTTGQNLVLFRFTGALQAPAAQGQLTIAVGGGNHRALDRMLGQSRVQTFSVGSQTVLLKWSQGVPTIVTAADLTQGDSLAINVRAPRGSTLAQVESTSANLVSDRGANPAPPAQPLWLFRGRVLAPPHSGALIVNVQSGNLRGMRALLHHGDDVVFSYDTSTVFLLWHGNVPTVIAPDDVRAGDRVAVRVRAPAGSSLAKVLSTPARHIGEHEPATPLAPPPER